MTTHEGPPPHPITPPPARLRLTLDGPEAEALWRLAKRDLRSMSDEALHLLRDAIRRAGEEGER